MPAIAACVLTAIKVRGRLYRAFLRRRNVLSAMLERIQRRLGRHLPMFVRIVRLGLGQLPVEHHRSSNVLIALPEHGLHQLQPAQLTSVLAVKQGHGLRIQGCRHLVCVLAVHLGPTLLLLVQLHWMFA